ncbi:MAG: 4-hydroxy-tetrahydrodipicolinate reductase, partial [Rhodothermia bacterium]|nr:4-hydroxy-tetrahydrodipicolinate reductase [Rhodothermia bacterium]
MRIALIGTGQMGSTIARLAAEYGHELSAVFSSSLTVDSKSAEDQLAESDVAIDFSAAAAVRSNVAAAVRMNVPIVVGTTGWNAEMEAVRSIVESGNGTMLFAPNFSLGVALLSHAIRAITPLLNRLDEFDPYISETHHYRKADSPSGTALHLGGIFLEGLDRKSNLLTGNANGPIEPAALQVASSRAGSVFGIHEVHIDGPDD